MYYLWGKRWQEGNQDEAWNCIKEIFKFKFKVSDLGFKPNFESKTHVPYTVTIIKLTFHVIFSLYCTLPVLSVKPLKEQHGIVVKRIQPDKLYT